MTHNISTRNECLGLKKEKTRKKRDNVNGKMKYKLASEINKFSKI